MERKETNKLMKQFFNVRAENWDVNGNKRAARIKDLINGMLHDGDKVLDIACGTGAIDNTLIELGAKKIVAIDLSEKMIEKAISKNTNPNITYKVMDFCEFDETGFDFAIIFNSYIHIVERDVFRNNLVKALNKGGRFAIVNTSNYERINKNHGEGEEVLISTPMKKPSEEKDLYTEFFDIDVMVDNEDTYVLSGVKK